MKKNYIKLNIAVLLHLILVNFCFAQKIIKMKNVNGVFQIPCKINGIPLNFIFDTGASEVSISITEAKFLIKQDLITKNDLLEKSDYRTADGSIVEGMKINIKTIDIDGIILENVKATIIDSQSAPLLLGQSAIKRLGRYSIENNLLTLYDHNLNSTNKDTSSKTSLKYVENINVDEEALKYYNAFSINEHWLGKDECSLKFNKYSNSFNYTSKRLISNKEISNEVAVFKSECSFDFDDITEVTTVILLQNREDNSDNIVLFVINLNKEIEERKISEKTGEIIPKDEIIKTNSIALDVFKNPSNKEIENLQKAIKDIFPGKKHIIKYGD
jgi:clan AA aspartic protease (TIGR02281 family)